MEHFEFCSDAEPFFQTVSENSSGTRLDHYLVQMFGERLTRSRMAALIKSGAISVNNREVKPGYRLKAGDQLVGRLDRESGESPPAAQPVEFEVLFEDESLIVISKPAGLVVHPGSGNQDRTLVNGLLHRYRELDGVGDRTRAGLVHRLDKDTSGVLVVARTPQAQHRLIQDFKDRRVVKVYLALLHGNPETDSGRIAEPIGRHPVHRQKMAIRQFGGRHAATSWRVERRFERHWLARIVIETGRTHQIRVHLAHLGWPVAGDRLYGPNRDNERFPRQLLHAWRLECRHPRSGTEVAFEAPLPDDFRQALENLGE